MISVAKLLNGMKNFTQSINLWEFVHPALLGMPLLLDISLWSPCEIYCFSQEYITKKWRGKYGCGWCLSEMYYVEFVGPHGETWLSICERELWPKPTSTETQSVHNNEGSTNRQTYVTESTAPTHHNIAVSTTNSASHTNCNISDIVAITIIISGTKPTSVQCGIVRGSTPVGETQPIPAADSNEYRASYASYTSPKYVLTCGTYTNGAQSL